MSMSRRRVDDPAMRLRIRLLNRTFLRANLRTPEEFLRWWDKHFGARSFVGRRAAALERRRASGKKPEPTRVVGRGPFKLAENAAIRKTHATARSVSG